jgi:hypothetical protein
MVSARSRVAFASGVGGLIGAALLLSGRFDGNVALALMFAGSARVAAAATLIDAGPIIAGGAQRSLARHVAFAPAWVFVVATGVVRAGSASLSDARGANSVAGLAIARGETVTVIGVWFAIAAGIIALASRTRIGVVLASSDGTTGRVVVPPSLDRLEIGAVLVQAALLVTLFAGPQVAQGSDGVAWGLGIAGIAAIAWFARDVEVAHAPKIAAGLATIGLVLAIAGGAP